MKYDFSRCNNLQFKAKGDEEEVMTGYLKVAEEAVDGVRLYYRVSHDDILSVEPEEE